MRKISKSEAHYSIAHADAIATTRLRATKTLAAISPRPSRGSVSVVFALAARRRARGHGKKNPGGA
jgi:hypothetical protein